MKGNQKILIGWKDRVNFPKLFLKDIKTKIDTGAYTSSIHCHQIRTFVDIDGQEKLKVNFLDPAHDKYTNKIHVFKNYSLKSIKSSNGLSEDRYIIKTKIELFKKIHTIKLTLSERSEMKFSVLIGRKFLAKKFVVDTSLHELSFQNKLIYI